MFNLMDLASKYLDIDKLTAGMPSFSKSESSDGGSYVLRKSRRKKKKPKNKKKIVIIKKKLQIPEPPKIIIVPQRVKRVKASKSAVAKNSSTSARNVKKPVKSQSEKSGKKDLDKKSNMPGQKGDTKKRSKKSNSLTVQKALKDFKKKKSQFLESLKLLQQHLSSVKAEDFLKNSKNLKNKERPKTRKDYQKSASESDVKVTKKTVQNEKIPKTVQNEKIQKTVPFRKEFSQFSSNDFFKCPPDGDTNIEEAVAVFPYEVCQIGFLENPQVENETNENGTKFVQIDDEMKFKMEENEKFDGNERLDSIVKSMKGMLPKCTVYRGRQ